MTISFFLRGLLTFLGLGILCFLLDLIICIAIAIKNTVVEVMAEPERQR